MNIVLLGAPGSGKGSLAALLKTSLNLQHISTGDILREEIKKGSELGSQAKSFIDQGKLVPDEIVTKLVEHKFKSDKKTEEGYMLDGFPRTSKQAEDLDKILKQVNQPLDYALYLESTTSVIIQRLGGRRVCKNCGALFHTKNKPSKKEGVCDICGGVLYQRPDDNPETIETRLKIYLETTKPIISYYEKKGLLKKMDSDLESVELEEILMGWMHEDTKRHKH
jgi:adenylate kinase